MENGVTGYFDVPGTKGMTVRVHYAETYDDKTDIPLGMVKVLVTVSRAS